MYIIKNRDILVKYYFILVIEKNADYNILVFFS